MQGSYPRVTSSLYKDLLRKGISLIHSCHPLSFYLLSFSVSSHHTYSHTWLCSGTHAHPFHSLICSSAWSHTHSCFWRLFHAEFLTLSLSHTHDLKSVISYRCAVSPETHSPSCEQGAFLQDSLSLSSHTHICRHSRLMSPPAPPTPPESVSLVIRGGTEDRKGGGGASKSFLLHPHL